MPGMRRGAARARAHAAARVRHGRAVVSVVCYKKCNSVTTYKFCYISCVLHVGLTRGPTSAPEVAPSLPW